MGRACCRRRNGAAKSPERGRYPPVDRHPGRGIVANAERWRLDHLVFFRIKADVRILVRFVVGAIRFVSAADDGHREGVVS